VDRHLSRLVYRCYEAGRWRLIQLNFIPGQDDLNVRPPRPRTPSGSNNGGVRRWGRPPWHRPYPRSGAHRRPLRDRPLVRGPGGALDGFGVRRGEAAIQELLSQVGQMPVADRARWSLTASLAPWSNGMGIGTARWNRSFSRLNSRGCAFEARGSIRVRAGGNASVMRMGASSRPSPIIDCPNHPRRRRRRGGTKIFLNAGTCDHPRRCLGGETRTQEVWHRDLNQPGLDPAQALLRRLHVNHVTGQVTSETLGCLRNPSSSPTINWSLKSGLATTGGALRAHPGQRPDGGGLRAAALPGSGSRSPAWSATG